MKEMESLPTDAKMSININLDQNDLIDIMVGSTQTDALEAIDKLEEEYTVANDRTDTRWDDKAGEHILPEGDQAVKDAIHKFYNIKDAPPWMHKIARVMDAKVTMTYSLNFNIKQRYFSVVDVENALNDDVYDYRRGGHTGSGSRIEDMLRQLAGTNTGHQVMKSKRQLTKKQSVQLINTKHKDNAIRINYRVEWDESKKNEDGNKILPLSSIVANHSVQKKRVPKVILNAIEFKNGLEEDVWRIKQKIGHEQYRLYSMDKQAKVNKAQVLKTLLSQTPEGQNILKLTGGGS